MLMSPQRTAPAETLEPSGRTVLEEDDGDDLETLCGAEIPAGKKETWTLSGTLVQDFDSETGMVRYLRNHAMEIVDFMYLPNAVGAETVTGKVQLLAVVEGGDINTRIFSDFEWDISGRPTWTETVTP